MPAAVSPCPDENVLLRVALGAGDEAELAAVEPHLDTCDSCRRVLAAAASDQALPSRPAVVAVGTRVGRYEVEGLVGVGGMGVVYAAKDPSLQRRVALKLLRNEGDAASKARLLREAQTMARLSHPNVVPIFELGEWEGRLFLAIELVEGATLDQWRRQPRAPGEVLAALVDAGRGLAAAHASGVVHRDFKPGNVLIGLDGRARVTDFGLARPATGPHVELAVTPGEAPSPELTHAGTLLGTLAYMAPEQLAGQPADARSDQFAWCLAVAEALTGRRPFEGATAEALSRSIARGPRLDGIPSRVRRVLARGLSVDPAARYGSMVEVLAALDRRGSAPLAAGVLGLAALALAGAVVLALRLQPPDPRVDSEARLAQLEVGQAVTIDSGAAPRLDTSDERVVRAKATPKGFVLEALAAGASCVVAWTDPRAPQQWDVFVGAKTPRSPAPCDAAPVQAMVATQRQQSEAAALDAGYSDASEEDAAPLPARDGLRVAEGKTRRLWIPGLAQVAVGDDTVADVRVAAPNVLEVVGRAPGHTTILVRSGGDSRTWKLEVTPAGSVALTLRRGSQRVIDEPGLSRVAVGDPSICDVRTVGGGQLLLIGVEKGHTTLILWVEGGSRRTYEVEVTD